MIVAPSRAIESSLVFGAVSITITEHGTPASFAAKATPWAALPALTVHTPSFICSRDSFLTAFHAPRILNEPIGGSDSSLRYTSGAGAPDENGRSSLMSGVRTAALYTCLAASVIASRG